MTCFRSLIRYLRKICFILLRTLITIMSFHILITLFLHTYIPPWNINSSPINAAILVLLYYAIPLITLLFFYLIMNQFIHLESDDPPKKKGKKQTKKNEKLPQED